VDVIEPCDEVLAYAFEAARRRRARLRALYAWRAPDRLTWVRPTPVRPVTGGGPRSGCAS
ncbi:hypothetical protein ACFQV4_26570, partial [Streptomyces thermocarboxydus]